MEEMHPPEIPHIPPIHESMGPTSDKSPVSSAEFSAESNLLAIGYEDGLVEVSVFELRSRTRIKACNNFRSLNLSTRIGYVSIRLGERVRPVKAPKLCKRALSRRCCGIRYSTMI